MKSEVASKRKQVQTSVLGSRGSGTWGRWGPKIVCPLRPWEETLEQSPHTQQESNHTGRRTGVPAWSCWACHSQDRECGGRESGGLALATLREGACSLAGLKAAGFLK